MLQSTRSRTLILFMLCLGLPLLSACTAPLRVVQPTTTTDANDTHPVASAVEPFSIVVSGLNQPRGMAIDEQGNLYVAEAGAQAAPSPGQHTPDPNQELPELNHSSRVLRIAPDGQISVMLDGLPYTYYPVSGDVGATDVALLDGRLYVLTGEGYDDDLSRMVLRVAQEGAQASLEQRIANIRRFAESVTPMDEMMLTGTAPSNPYAMIVAPYALAPHTVTGTSTQTADLKGDDTATSNDEEGGGAAGANKRGPEMALFVTDGATGRIMRITLDGEIRTFAELPNLLPIAGLAMGPDHRLYFTMFSERPHTAGTGAIWAVNADGVLEAVVQHLTMPIDVAFAPDDPSGALYVLEFGSNIPAQQLYAPASGRLLRLELDANGAGTQTVLLEGLNYPTTMTFAPNGDLYIAVGGAFTGAGQGAILHVPCTTLGDTTTCRPRP